MSTSSRTAEVSTACSLTKQCDSFANNAATYDASKTDFRNGARHNTRLKQDSRRDPASLC